MGWLTHRLDCCCCRFSISPSLSLPVLCLVVFSCWQNLSEELGDWAPLLRNCPAAPVYVAACWLDTMRQNASLFSCIAEGEAWLLQLTSSLPIYERSAKVQLPAHLIKETSSQNQALPNS
ncbi:unnamed protein product [Pleuronectes platessa]|uniref:Uncharacterized protein n=1 Tax=Pleuronectes platessa TaxID=8262 RepID=A0A9N7YIT7_PLEPL|nr:unnamed protein product [Pleuronectes platessa]